MLKVLLEVVSINEECLLIQLSPLNNIIRKYKSQIRDYAVRCHEGGQLPIPNYTPLAAQIRK